MFEITWQGYSGVKEPAGFFTMQYLKINFIRIQTFNEV